MAPRRLMLRHGRDAIVRRRVGTSDAFITATVKAHQTTYSPSEIAGEMKHGDARIFVQADAVIAAGLHPLRNGDQVVLGGRTWLVQGVPVVKAIGDVVTHYECWCRGG